MEIVVKACQLMYRRYGPGAVISRPRRRLATSALRSLAAIVVASVAGCGGSARTRTVAVRAAPRSEAPAGESSAGARGVGNVESAASDPTPADLASRVRNAYLRANEIEFDATVNGMGLEIHCKVKSCADGRHHLEVQSAARTTIYTLDEEPVGGGRTRVQEHNLIVNKRADYVLTDDEFEPYKWDARCADAGDIGFDACLFGGYLYPWLGPTGHEPGFLAGLIASATYKGPGTLGTAVCDVVETGRPQRPGEEIWVERHSGFILRWRDQCRDRVFVYRRFLARVGAGS